MVYRPTKKADHAGSGQSILVVSFECRFLATEVDGLNPGNSMFP